MDHQQQSEQRIDIDSGNNRWNNTNIDIIYDCSVGVGLIDNNNNINNSNNDNDNNNHSQILFFWVLNQLQCKF